MKSIYRDRTLLLVYSMLSIIIVSCIKNDPARPSVPPQQESDSSKSITSFIFKADKNPGLTSDWNGIINGDSIYVVVPQGTDFTNLVPVINITGISISPASLSAQNFSQPVQFIVTARDGTTKKYWVVVGFEKIPATIFICTDFEFGTVTEPPSGKVYALDANTGSIKWYYAPADGKFVASPVFSDGVLYAANWNKITAIDTVTKNIRWEYSTGKKIQSALLVKNGIIYANCDDGYLYAVDEATGNLRWKFAQETVDTIHSNMSSPTVVDGVVYFGSTRDSYVYAVDAGTGNLKWKTHENSALGWSPFESSPVVVDGTLYIGNFYFRFLALNINDGSIKWALSNTAGFAESSATIVNGVAYIGSNDGTLYAINTSDGTIKWTHYIGSTIHTSPVVYNGTVFFGSSGGLNTEGFYALDANDGSQKWVYLFGTDMLSDPVAFNGMVYFSSYEGLYALDVTTGALKWKFDTILWRENIFASPCIVDELGHVYYAARSGHKD
jgi:outer membrane protein assembly factor BamB